MESESYRILENQEKEPRHFRAVIVAPGFERDEHRTGLHWDTRFRLFVASALFASGRAERIIVGGGRLRRMQTSFAERMKTELVQRGVPVALIETEEDTFDTASQIEWMTRHRGQLGGNLGFITDPAQAGHVQELLRGFGIEEQCSIVSTEDIIQAMDHNKHFLAFFERLHRSPYWKHWQLREKFLELFTRYCDPRGEKIAHLTRQRKT